MTRANLAVTGSTGAIGGMVAKSLAANGAAQRLLVRDPERAPKLEGAEVVKNSYEDSEASIEALDGVDTLFMVSAPESVDRLDKHRAFIDSAARAGVRHLVYTSFFGAAPDATFTFARAHYTTEEYIKASGMSYTFLRDNFYLDFMPSLVGEDGVIRGPAGDGSVSMVARADIAAAAVAVLLDIDAHRDATYDMTGPESFTMLDAAQILSQAEGREVTYYDETIAEAFESRKKWPAEDWEYDAWVSTYTAMASGEVAAVSSDIETLTGRRPMSLAEFLASR